MGQHQFEELSSKIIAAGIDVHKALGPGFIEGVYQKAMEVAFRHRKIPFERQKEIHLYFEEEDLGVQRIDLHGSTSCNSNHTCAAWVCTSGCYSTSTPQRWR